MAINLAKTHAKIFGRTSLKPSDNRLLQRVLLDTCPSRRLQLVQVLLNYENQVSVEEISAFFPGLPYMGMRQLIEDLKLLEIIEVEKVFKDRFVVLTERFREMLTTAQVPAVFPQRNR
jgi:hypothetical protein